MTNTENIEVSKEDLVSRLKKEYCLYIVITDERFSAHYGLNCQIRVKEGRSRGIITTKRLEWYEHNHDPPIDDYKQLDELARIVSQEFPFKEGDDVTTTKDSIDCFVIASHPIKKEYVEYFKKRIVEFTQTPQGV